MTDIAFRPEIVAERFKHPPTIVLGPNNALFLVGQMYFDVNGVVTAGNGRTILINTQKGAGPWSELAAPVAVPAAADNYCESYSTPLLPSVNGASILEIATDNDGIVCKPYFVSGPVSGTPTAPVAQRAYGGDERAIANGSTIQAENYDVGGAGVAYSDTSAGNARASYRTDVDIEVTTDTGGGYNLDWTAAGEGLEYTVNTTARLTMTARVASAATAPADFRLLLDGAVLGTFATVATGGWQTWADVSSSGIPIFAGTNRVLRIEVVGGNDYNLNCLRFTSDATPTAKTQAMETASTRALRSRPCAA